MVKIETNPNEAYRLAQDEPIDLPKGNHND